MELSTTIGAIEMRLSFYPPPHNSSALGSAPWSIAMGLAMLLIAVSWPAVPAVTAMAVVALGATGVTIERYRTASALVPLMLLHLAIYSVLYALFVGATLHGAAAHRAGGLTAVQLIDLLVSVVPMVIVVWLSTSAGRRDRP